MKRLNEAARRLARLWLVVTKDGGERLAIEGLTKEMARARINRLPNGDEFKQRFVAHFLAYAESHNQPKPEDYDALEAERENLLGAMDIAFEAQDWRTVMRLMNTINPGSAPGMLSVRGYWDEAKERGKQALIASRKLQDEESIARYAHNLAIIYQNQGDLDEARSLYHQSLDIKRKLGAQSGISKTLHQLGLLAQAQGDLDEARSLYHQSFDIKRKLGAQSGISKTLHQLGLLAQDQGDLDEARSLYQQSLDIARKLGDQIGIAISLGQLGRLAEDEGDKTEAARLFHEALTIFERLKSPYAELARKDLERVEGQDEG